MKADDPRDALAKTIDQILVLANGCTWHAPRYREPYPLDQLAEFVDLFGASLAQRIMAAMMEGAKL